MALKPMTLTASYIKCWSPGGGVDPERDDEVAPLGCLLSDIEAARWLLSKWLIKNWRPGINAPRCGTDGVAPEECLLGGVAAAW